MTSSMLRGFLRIVVLKAVAEVRNSGVKIHEVYSPFPVHGLEFALGYKRTRMPIAAFMFGFLGLSLAITMQTWMLGVDLRKSEESRRQ